MPDHDATHPPHPVDIPADASLEECIDELGALITWLERYPPEVLVLALRVHLAALLGVLRAHGLCTRKELRVFLRSLEREVLAG